MNRFASVVVIGVVGTLASVGAFASLRVARAPSHEGAETTSEPPALAALGKRIFFDASLSEPAGTSCASCHDATRGYAGNHGSSIGVALGSAPDHVAKRNTPSVLYLGLIHRFHFHWEEDAPLPDGVGGFFWDGRTDSLADLTRQPLLNADEMGNRDVTQLAHKITASAFAVDLRRAVGPIDGPESAVNAIGKAVEAFLLSEEMSPFTSKYDDVIRHRAAFTADEARGLALFKNPAKGNCVSCHKMNDSIPDPARSPFSDFGFETVGVPRNARLPANHDPKYFDLGLCEHADARHQTSDARFCGAFRTPSLATSPSAPRSCTTARSRASATSSPSTPRAPPIRSAGTAPRPTTTSPRSTAGT